MFVWLFVYTLFFFGFVIDIEAQNYTSKYNSLLERYEYFDSNGNMIGYKKWNSLYDRWEYTDKSQQNNRSRYESPYNLDLIQKAVIHKQQQHDRNLDLIYDKLDEIYETLDNVVDIKGKLSNQELEEVTKFEKEVNETCRCDLSNTGNVRKIILWLNNWKRYFQSWGKSSISKGNNNNIQADKYQENKNVNYPKTVYFKSSVIIWDHPAIAKGKKIGDAKGSVKVLEKITEQCHKIEFNGIVGYIYGSLNR